MLSLQYVVHLFSLEGVGDLGILVGAKKRLEMGSSIT